MCVQENSKKWKRTNQENTLLVQMQDVGDLCLWDREREKKLFKLEMCFEVLFLGIDMTLVLFSINNVNYCDSCFGWKAQKKRIKHCSSNFTFNGAQNWIYLFFSEFSILGPCFFFRFLYGIYFLESFCYNCMVNYNKAYMEFKATKMNIKNSSCF